VEISHDVIFDEDVALGKICNLPLPRNDKEVDLGKKEELKDEMMPNAEGPMDPIDPPPHEPSSSMRIPSWLQESFEDVERHVAPMGKFHGRKKPNRYQWYLTEISTIVQFEPCIFEEVANHQVWKFASNNSFREP